MHICNICGKEFDSGSSLGGHMSIVHCKRKKRPKISIVIEIRHCKKCGLEFEVNKLHNKSHCSRICANGRVKSQASKDKLRATAAKKRVEKPPKREMFVEKKCHQCQKIFLCSLRKHKRKFCSRVCSCINVCNRPESREKFMKVAKMPTSHKAMKGLHGPRLDISSNINFKSSWEADFARILMYEKKIWEYEPVQFKLSNGTGYTPDFLVNGIYVEIKGHLKAGSVRHQAFCLDNPTEKFVLIAGEALFYALLNKYSNVIEFENKKYVDGWRKREKLDNYGVKTIITELKLSRHIDGDVLNIN